MTKVNFSQMSSKELVEWYNARAGEGKQIKKFSDRKTAERRCSDLIAAIEEEPEVNEEPAAEASSEAPEETPAPQRPTMSASLKLDRRIVCVETEQVWKNAHTMWVENPDWMTSSQQDRLTAQLYKAAKAGQKISVTVGDRQFQLLNV